jgi:hypothetical protein
VINAIYEINGKQYEYLKCRTKKFFELWYSVLVKRGAKIIRIWED